MVTLNLSTFTYVHESSNSFELGLSPGTYSLNGCYSVAVSNLPPVVMTLSEGSVVTVDNAGQCVVVAGPHLFSSWVLGFNWALLGLGVMVVVRWFVRKFFAPSVARGAVD